MAVAPKVYDFPMAKVEDQVVTFLRKSRGEATVADMIAATGLPKYQVEQAARSVLDEYAGRLKVTESGELLYYFPEGMQSTRRGVGPSLRRSLRAFARGAAKVLAFLFKIWIVVMLVGYFVAFLAIAVLAVLASFAASAASKGERGGRDRGGFGGMYLVLRLLDLILRMWFWSNLLKDPKRARQGRAFYKSVFGFIFGEADPNKGWDEAERTFVISYIRSRKGVITVEELMALSGRDVDAAHALMHRLLVEYEGEPGVTDDGTVVYAFPALMRTSGAARQSPGQVPVLNPASKRLVPFSDNKRRTNGWIAFFNAANLAFGCYFLGVSVFQGAAALGRTGSYLYSFAGNMLVRAGIDAVPFLAVVLGVVPVVFSILFFAVPLVRKLRLDRHNARIREEELRRRIYAQVLASPSRVDPKDVRPTKTEMDPKNLPALRQRIIDKLAAAMNAEPVTLEDSTFAYRFTELERQLSDLEAFRRGIDAKKYEVGATIFDSGK
jgi:hypothetical protein